MSPQTPQDAATSVALNYLAAIEQRLKITWDASNQPACVVDRIEDAALKALGPSLRHWAILRWTLGL
jgi:hypothetical protein